MILVDTSVWVDHLRSPESNLIEVLEQSQVCMHPYVMGEIACGSFRSRSKVLEAMHGLPQVLMAEPDEVLHFIDERRLMGKGIGYVDASLLASCVLDSNTKLWTRDKRLAAVARTFKLLAPNK
jgi:predicted nucleic acid-binding protein